MVYMVIYDDNRCDDGDDGPWDLDTKILHHTSWRWQYKDLLYQRGVTSTGEKSVHVSIPFWI